MSSVLSSSNLDALVAQPLHLQNLNNTCSHVYIADYLATYCAMGQPPPSCSMYLPTPAKPVIIPTAPPGTMSVQCLSTINSKNIGGTAQLNCMPQCSSSKVWRLKTVMNQDMYILDVMGGCPQNFGMPRKTSVNEVQVQNKSPFVY
ncbi:hypothetical protein B0H10DRAFT_1939218 [Mycena sp. CBHHK59/15]|nr:hypothetical protein B0H10DRAFT_1939218 [Mycena sp. CBHHK59/15]